MGALYRRSQAPKPHRRSARCVTKTCPALIGGPRYDEVSPQLEVPYQEARNLIKRYIDSTLVSEIVYEARYTPTAYFIGKGNGCSLPQRGRGPPTPHAQNRMAIDEAGVPKAQGRMADHRRRGRQPKPLITPA